MSERESRVTPGEESGDADDPRRVPSSLANAFAILRCFSADCPELGVTDVARMIGVHKSTVSRMMTSLQQLGYLHRDASTDKYRLGVSLLALVSPLLSNVDVRRIAHPLLQDEVARTHETAAIAVIEDVDPIVIDQIPSPKLVRHTQEVGTRYRGWASASVKVSLAFRPWNEAEQALRDGRIEGVDRSDQAVFARIRSELADIRQEGFALNDGESDPFEFSLAAPVFGADGALMAALVIAAPKPRVTPAAFAQIRDIVLHDAHLISRQLGYVEGIA
ncbi:IclR family transcriptional regulator [Bifidobacterium goeldii]|nr:IclR family transcriptional regulator [Bifidobacterium goeldii]